MRHARLVTACISVRLAFAGVTVGAAGPQTQIRGESYNVTFGSGRSVDAPRRALAEVHDRNLDRVADRTLARPRITPSLRYRHAVHGFAARLTAIHLRALRRDPNVRSISADQELAIDDAASPRRPGVDAT